MAEQQTSPAFTRVLERFQRRLSSQNNERFKFATFEDLKVAVKDIQKDQAGRDGLRNLNKIRPFLNGLEQYAQVIQVFVNAKPDLLAFIWGPIKLCLQIASKLTEAFDALLNAYERIGESLPVFSAVDHLFYSHGHVQQVLADTYEDILDFHKRAIIFFEQRTWKLAFKLTYHTFSDMFGDVLKNLERSKELLLQTASVAHFQKAQEARLLFTREFEAQTERDNKHRSLTVVEWLSPVSPLPQHEELQEKRRELPDTTRWIFNTMQMRDWLHVGGETNPAFWLCGIPGAGKTVLFSSVVDEINEKFPESQTIFFYCRSSDPSRRTFEGISRSLIAQILHLNPACLDFLYDKVIDSGERHPSTNTTYWEILKTIAVNHSLLFVGIDGLDECEEPQRRLILSMIENLLEESNAEKNIKFFITSRREKDIQRSLCSATRFDIRPHHLEKDIRTYVEVRSSILSKKFGFGLEREKHITADIASRPKGMFLLARLIMDNLLDQDNLEDLEEELNSDILPNGINQAYGRILVRLRRKDRPEKSRRRAALGLEIITTARRALKVRELQGALSIRLEDRTMDFEMRRSRTPLGELCGPIVEVHSDGIIDLIHPTAREYLFQHHSGYFIDPVAAEFKMACLCTTYLTLNSFNPGLERSEVQRYVTAGDYSFQEYATCHWLYHIGSLQSYRERFSDKEVISFEESCSLLHLRHNKQGSLELLTSSCENTGEECQDASKELDFLRKTYGQVETISGNEVYLKSVPYLLSHISQVRSIIEELSAQEMAGSTLFTEAYGTSLFKCPIISCPHFHQGFRTRRMRDEHCERHERRFKCKFEGCDFLELGFSSNSTLTRHIQLCHEVSPDEGLTFPTIKRFSISKALINAIDKDDALAVRGLSGELSALNVEETGFLLRAVKRESWAAALALVEILGTENEVNHKDKCGRTALHGIIAKGSERLLGKILETDVDVNARDADGRTPLLVAALEGRFQMVRLLLGHERIKLELDPLGSPGKLTRRAIILAASGGHEDALRVFLKTYTVDFSPDTSTLLPLALKEAASNGHKSIVKFILDLVRGLVSDPNVRMRVPRAFLKLASGDAEATAAALMRPKPEVNSKGIARDGSLQTAALKGDTSTVMRLLNLGANINQTFYTTYGTALAAAAMEGQLAMVQLLLDKGADYRKGGYKGSAIHFAASKGNEEVVRLLLDKGADPNEKNFYGSPISRAAEGGHDAIVRLLLDNGAYIDTEDSCYNRDALKVAAIKGHERVVRLLLDRGADANAFTLGLYEESEIRRKNGGILAILGEARTHPNSQGAKTGATNVGIQNQESDFLHNIDIDTPIMDNEGPLEYIPKTLPDGNDLPDGDLDSDESSNWEGLFGSDYELDSFRGPLDDLTPSEYFFEPVKPQQYNFERSSKE